MVNLLHTGRKLFLASSVYNVNLSAETKSSSGSVHRYVSAAYYSYLVSCCDRCVIIVAEGLHQVASCQVLVSGEYAVGVLSRNSHELRKSCTGTDKYGVEALFLHQLVDGNRFSNYYVCLNLYAQLSYVVNLRLNNAALRKTELWNTVGKNAACLVKGLENLYFISKLGQIACTGKSCRAGTNDSDSLAVLLLSCLRNKAVLSCPVSNKTLQLSDGNRLSLDSSDTFSLTLALLRTNAAADSRKCGRLGDNLCRLLNISFFYLLNKGRNIDGYRTSLDALCVLAV